MPQYLRSVRQGRWQPPDWLPPDQNEVQADALRDLATDSNVLSVYLVESEQDIDRIVIALAATRDNPQNVDYAVFGDDEFRVAGIEVIESEGATPDRHVNELHRDLGKLTARQLSTLASIITKGRIRRRTRSQVRRGIQNAIKSGVLDADAINGNLRSRLGYIAQPSQPPHVC